MCCVSPISTLSLAGLHFVPLAGLHFAPLAGLHFVPLAGLHFVPLAGLHFVPLAGLHPVQRGLSAVSDDEWNAIPDVGDARNKKQRNPHIRPDRYSVGT